MSYELTAFLSVFDIFLTQWIKATLSKGCKPDKFESHNSPKCSFMNIWDLCLNFVECGSFLEGLPSINLKGFYYSYTWSCSLREGRTSFPKGLTLENSAILTYVFHWLYFTQCLTSFTSTDCLLRLYARFFILFHLT